MVKLVNRTDIVETLAYTLANPVARWTPDIGFDIVMCSMSERFVRGWKVSVQKLYELIGSRQVTASQVIDSSENAKCRQDVLMSLGQGDEAQGRTIAEKALTAVLDGQLEFDQSYKYARVMELLFNHVGLPLARDYSPSQRDPLDQILLQLTYAVPNESHGRWNPLLEECKLPKLAKAWAAPNFAFPWADADGPDKGAWPWPLWTVYSSSALSELEDELKTLTKERMSAIPIAILSDDEESAEACREELWDGLRRLGIWINAAQAAQAAQGLGWTKQGNALVTLMDGDQ
jgi:hypothetical protein